jgi:hypothetical protein
LKAINGLALPYANPAALFHENADKDEYNDKADTYYEPLPGVRHGIPPKPLARPRSSPISHSRELTLEFIRNGIFGNEKCYRNVMIITDP